MTPSEAKTFGGITNFVGPKKMGSETVVRKASFKCPTPNKAASQRVARKIVLPISTVQALTNKFNELSQANQGQKHKITQASGKSKSGAKQSTIKVVICRKSSSSKYKRPDDASRRRIRKFQPSESDILKEDIIYKNVHQKIHEYEGQKKSDMECRNTKNANLNRTTKMQMPKILVDIDLGADSCSVNHKNLSELKSGHEPSQITDRVNSLSVKAAISLFENSSGTGTLDKRNVTVNPKEESNGRETFNSKIINGTLDKKIVFAISGPKEKISERETTNSKISMGTLDKRKVIPPGSRSKAKNSGQEITNSNTTSIPLDNKGAFVSSNPKEESRIQESPKITTGVSDKNVSVKSGLKDESNVQGTIHSKIAGEDLDKTKVIPSSDPKRKSKAQETINSKIISGILDKKNTSVPSSVEDDSSVMGTKNFQITTGTLDKKNILASSKQKEEIKILESTKISIDIQSKTENSNEIKTKPIAAIKPILKKTEDRTSGKKKFDLKDSLNRKKYVAMKKELTKEGKDILSEDFLPNGEEALRVTEAGEKDVEKVKQKDKDRLQNNSSLHRNILQSNIIINEITLKEFSAEQSEAAKEATDTGSLQPNTSFLWSKKEETYGEKSPTSRIDLPLPVPPENVPEIPDLSETIYDDVIPVGEDYESEEFEKMDSESETYDDVRVYWKNNKTESEIHREVQEKNQLNKLCSSKTSEALYESPGKYLYSYDDGEGERYQYISEKTVSTANSEEKDFGLYQYIQNGNDDNNIYEDIQSIQCNTNDKSKGIYEDINCETNSLNGVKAIDNCYESVYNRMYTNEAQAYIKSDVSDTSNNSGRSTYVKSNSLYGMSAGNVIENDNSLNLTEGNGSLETAAYHLNAYDSETPNSETSQSNSDEWVEVSESESEANEYVYIEYCDGEYYSLSTDDVKHLVKLKICGVESKNKTNKKKVDLTYGLRK